VLAEIKSLKEQFDLSAQEDNSLNMLNAEMIVAWSDLYDMLSSKLVRYGNYDKINFAER